MARKKVFMPGDNNELPDAQGEVQVSDNNELPDADDIDASTLTSAVLTKQGWLLPNGGKDVQ